MDSLLGRDCNRLNTRITVMSKQDKDFTELQMKSLKRLKAKELLSAYPFKNKGLHHMDHIFMAINTEIKSDYCPFNIKDNIYSLKFINFVFILLRNKF